MTHIGKTVVSLLVFASFSGATPSTGQSNPFNDTLLIKVRAAARMVPGELPTQIGYLKFAGSKAPLREMIETTQDSTLDGALTVFQIRYPRGWIMVDAGMARDVDSTFPGVPGALNRVREGLRGARLIVVTHEHHDHVAEVVRPPMAELVAAKTVLTRAQVQTLIDRPIVPLIRLIPNRSRDYVVIDYDLLYPLAPGVVLIKSPGHTPGSQMVYVHLASGKEFLFIGDIAWAMAGIQRRVQKPEKTSRALIEDRVALQQQLDWLSGLTQRQGVVLVNSHDETWLRGLVSSGVLKADLDLSSP
jgi:glyoxylase-like metal-dependent hydrolase (beta-lactamase superfamily II)